MSKNEHPLCPNGHQAKSISGPSLQLDRTFYCVTCDKNFHEKVMQIYKANLNESGAYYSWEVGSPPYIPR